MIDLSWTCRSDYFLLVVGGICGRASASLTLLFGLIAGSLILSVLACFYSACGVGGFWEGASASLTLLFGLIAGSLTLSVLACFYSASGVGDFLLTVFCGSGLSSFFALGVAFLHSGSCDVSLFAVLVADESGTLPTMDDFFSSTGYYSGALLSETVRSGYMATIVSELFLMMLTSAGPSSSAIASSRLFIG